MLVILNASCVQKTHGVTILLQGLIGKANVPLTSHPVLVAKAWFGIGIPLLFNFYFSYLQLRKGK